MDLVKSQIHHVKIFKEWYQRLHRAHLNTTENAPVFASLVVCSVLLGVKSPIIAKLCVLSVLARILQSICHIIRYSLI